MILSCYIASLLIWEFQGVFLNIKNPIFNGEQENESIICVRILTLLT